MRASSSPRTAAASGALNEKAIKHQSLLRGGRLLRGGLILRGEFILRGGLILRGELILRGGLILRGRILKDGLILILRGGLAYTHTLTAFLWAQETLQQCRTSVQTAVS